MESWVNLETTLLSEHQEVMYAQLIVHHLPTTSLAFVITSFVISNTCAQSRLTLCGPVDHSLPGSSAHEIFQARILEWVAVPSSRASSQMPWEPRHETQISYVYLHWQADPLPLEPPGNLHFNFLAPPMDLLYRQEI